MKEEAATDASLRQFLLGKVGDEERQRIESLFLIDSVIKERVFAAEQELIDDYVEDRLSPADREIFLSVYGDTGAQQRKLRIAKSIQQWAANRQATPLPARPAVSAWGRFLEHLRLKPVLVIPIAVAAIVAVVVAIVWVNSRRTDGEYLAMQQELARLNSPSSLREVIPETSIVMLKPGGVRGTESETELRRHPDRSVEELRLLWMQSEDYPSYRAVLHQTGVDQSFTISNLIADKENGKFIRVRLPIDKLPRGTYWIELTGIAGDGTESPPEIYGFTLSE